MGPIFPLDEEIKLYPSLKDITRSGYGRKTFWRAMDAALREGQ